MVPTYRKDTIAAIATPQGIGALGIVRVSGPDAIVKINGLFPNKDLETIKSHTLHFGPIIHEGELIDEVLISVFRAPHSFTGENSVEISCHGSPYILQKLMEALAAIGISPAEPGEYTLRAYLNGRMDLSQAEAVADLIAAESKAAHDTAMQQMRGGFSLKIKELRAQLLYFASLIELELDFAEEDVEFADRGTLINLLDTTYMEAAKLAASFQLGNAIKSGVKVVIAGRPNAGKSTLLNALLNEERALVSDIPGTTRDSIEDVLVVDGIKFRFIDTAGIRDPAETIERMGIARTFEKIKEADIIVYLYDVNTTSPQMLRDDIETFEGKNKIILVGNKIDSAQEDKAPFETGFQFPSVQISAKKGLHIDAFKSLLIQSLDLAHVMPTGQETIVTNIRHFNSLNHVLMAIDQIRAGLQLHITGDLLAADIKSALRSMAEITGEITSDEILGNIFGKFCIGK